jgi:hypothetical protein
VHHTHRDVSSVKRAWSAGLGKLFPILKDFDSVPYIFYDEEYVFMITLVSP